MNKKAGIKLDYNHIENISGMSPSYPYVMHVADFDVIHIPWHWHQELEINYVVSGNLKVHTSNQDYAFKAGEAFFMNSNVLSSMDGTEHCIIHSHVFHPVFLSGHFKSVFETKYINPVVENRQLEVLRINNDTENRKEILEKIKYLTKLNELEDTEFRIRNTLSDIWSMLIIEINSSPQKTSASSMAKKERLIKMMDYIKDNYSGKVTLDQLAESVMMSKQEVIRCFNEGIHKSPMEFLQEHRMAIAASMLIDSDDTITEIAYSVGYPSSAYFTKVFGEYYGLTPKEYRKKMRH